MTTDSIATFRIDVGADLADLWGGQTDFEVAVYVTVNGETDIIGAGHTVRQAVREARATLRGWRRYEAFKSARGYTTGSV